VLTRDVITISATNALLTLGGLVSGIVVARMLGPEGRGALAMILLWPGIIGHLGALGADVELGRRAARDRTMLSQNVFVAAILACMYGTVLIIPVVVMLPIVFSGEKHQFVEIGRLAMLAVPAIVLNSNLGAIALGTRQVWIFNVGRTTLTAVYIVFVLLSWAIAGASLTGVVVAYLLSIWCGTPVTFLLLTRMKGSGKPVSNDDLLDVARAGVAFAPGIVISAITNNLSILLLTALGDARSLGLYVVALTFANAQQIVSQALAKTAFASMVYVVNESETRAVVALQLRQSIAAISVLAVVVVLVGRWVLPWIFGAQFSSASALLIYLAPGVAFFALGQVIEEMLKAKGIAAPSVFARIISGVCISTCAMLLIPRAGGVGMAMSFLIGGLVECLVFFNSLRVRLKLSAVDLVVLRVRT